MGAVDPEGNLRKLDWNNPNERLKDDEIGLNEKQYNVLKPLSKTKRAATYAELRQKGFMPQSVLPKSLRK